MTHILFQVGTVFSVLANTKNSLPVRDILSQGNYGLGTFKSDNGEMIIWNGKAYRSNVDGRLTLIKPSTHSHYCMVCPWQKTSSIHIKNS